MRMIRLSEQYVGELIDGRIGRRGPQLPGSALAIGSFDGLHRGHQELLRGVLSAQERLGLGAAGVFTFTQHPRQTLDPGSAPFLLTTWPEKLAALKELGCPVVIAADFCPQLSRLGYREFVGRFLVGYLGMKRGGGFASGALLGSRKLELAQSSLRVGEPLEVRVTQVMSMPPAAQYECVLSRGGETLAKGTINVAMGAPPQGMPEAR